MRQSAGVHPCGIRLTSIFFPARMYPLPRCLHLWPSKEMVMSKKLLTVVIEELIANSNGDFPDATPSDDADQGLKNNALSASLRYPRSGAPQITSAKQYDLANGKPATLLDPQHPDNFFDPLLFREEVIDRTVLNLKLTDRDAASGFEKFLLGVFSRCWELALRRSPADCPAFSALSPASESTASRARSRAPVMRQSRLLARPIRSN